jgi:hypothetical protein
VKHAFRRAAVPLAWYYAITIGLPLANGASARGVPFVKHTIVVLAVPLLLILVASAACDVARVVRSTMAHGRNR